MSILTAYPTAEVFSSVPFIDVAAQKFAEEDIASHFKTAGALFAKYNVYNDFALSMIHRHFDLNHNELLVEATNATDTVSVAMPWKLNGNSANPYVDDRAWTDFELEQKGYIVPRHWRFDEDGTLVPFEFMTTDDPHLPHPSAEFAAELYQLLKNVGVEGCVGLIRLGPGKSWETTPPGSRRSVTVFGEQPEHLKSEEMVQISWYFDENGELMKGRDWCGVCSHNCGTCTH